MSSVATSEYYNIINKKFFPRFCLFNAESCFFNRRVAENRRILSYDHLNTRGQTWWSKRLFCSFYALSPLEISIKFDIKTSTNISLCSSFIYMYILHFDVCQSYFFMSCVLCNTFFRIKGNLRDIHLVENVVQNKLSIESSHKNDWIWFHQNKSVF